MLPEEQTTEVRERLYKLTLQFVRKYQPRYYKQYRGDLEDLAMEFYCEFLTPKSRVQGKEQSLLDKYDVNKKPDALSEEVFFANLVKVSVTRMLIDRSRADTIRVSSIDRFVDEFGDVMVKTFNLSTEDEDESVDDFEFDKNFLETLKVKFRSLPKSSQTSFIKSYKECRSVLAKKFIILFDKLLNNDLILVLDDGTECNIQQITERTVCAFVPKEQKVIDFDRETGESRGKYDYCLSSVSLDVVSNYDKFHSGLSRNLFEEKFRIRLV